MESVSRRCIIELACELCSDWKKLGNVLGLSKEVEQIKQDYRNNVVEQAYRILQAWKQKNGSKATYQLLGAALRKETMSRIDLAEKYCEGGNQGSSSTGFPSEHFKTGRISDSDVDDIASCLGKKWMWVGRLLELEDTLLDDIKERNDKQYDCSHEMLLSWTQKSTTQATYECLAQALLHGAVGMGIVAEKYCLNEHREAQSASYVPPEDIRSLNSKMEQLQVAGVPKETGYTGNCSRNADVERANKNQTGLTHQTPVPDDCIRKQFISTLPYKVWGVLVIKLDPLRELPLRGDFRDLAGELGFNTETILYFKSLKNPTETVLTKCSSLSVEKLCNKLETIGRVDAKMAIDEWVKSQDCKCVACTDQNSS